MATESEDAQATRAPSNPSQRDGLDKERFAFDKSDPESSDKSKVRRALFVERQTYRRRRLVDAARALPLLGVMLWLVPLLWGNTDTPPEASTGLIYVFAVWVILPLLAAGLILAMALRGGSDEGEQK